MATLKQLIAGDKPVLATLALNPMMAKLAEAAGFPALYLGGGAMGYLKLDLEANLNLTEMVQAGIDIRTGCDLPLILDGACGWGDPMHMHRTVRMAEAAGFAALEVEDQILPKRAHHHIGIEHIIPQELMAAKIRECVAARKSEEFVIVGRTNGIRSTDMDDALRRAEAYKRAGADLMMLSPRNPEEIRHVHDRLGGPFMYNAPRGGTAGFGMTVQELYDNGCRILVDTSTPLLAAYQAWKDVYRKMAGTMAHPDFPPEVGKRLDRDMLDDIGLQKWLDIEKATVEK